MFGLSHSRSERAISQEGERDKLTDSDGVKDEATMCERMSKSNGCLRFVTFIVPNM
jgi:hypothetical protein